ncbi:MAG: hypothetical protein R2746_05630 [Acidimicrobiales bacterium]
MGFNNPSMPWSELERRLGGRVEAPVAADVPEWANRGDAPAWSCRRDPYRPPAGLARPASGTPYAELHCHSNFSFLDGASHPEELAEAARLGLEASPSPTTTASTGWSASPRRPARWGCPPCSVPSSPSTARWRPHGRA